MKDEKSDIMVIPLPKWMNEVTISMFLDYMRTGEIHDFNDSTYIHESNMQKLLWIADYFQIDKLQEKCIKKGIFPRISKDNAIIFINEAYKKLKASEKHDDIWYELLNNGLEISAKNILYIIKQYSNELMKMNGKLFEEIIERVMKIEKFLGFSQMEEIIDFLLIIRKIEDIFDLLSFQKKSLMSKSSFEGILYNLYKYSYIKKISREKSNGKYR